MSAWPGRLRGIAYGCDYNPEQWPRDVWDEDVRLMVSQDHYLEAHDPDAHVELSWSADLCRGTARGEPWFLMEHSTSAVNWQRRNIAKQPGQLRRNSLAHVARGADAVCFFQWRASRAGAEKYHSALVQHAGTDTKVWSEVVELGASCSCPRCTSRPIAARRTSRRTSSPVAQHW